MNYIHSKFYKKIIQTLPIACVDICLVNVNNQVLFVKRKQEPAKNEWWIPGGRILIGETIKEAAIRKVKEEIGIDISDRNIYIIHFGETIFKNKKDKIIRHSLNAVVGVFITDKQIKLIKLDKTSSDWAWHTDKKVKIKHEYLKQCIDAVYLKFKKC